MSSRYSLLASIGRMEHHLEEHISAETNRVFTTVLRDPWLLKKSCLMLKIYQLFSPALPSSWKIRWYWPALDLPTKVIPQKPSL
jgi:hypothetical protein